MCCVAVRYRILNAEPHRIASAKLVALLVVKASTDLLVICAAVGGLALIFVGERLFLRARYGRTDEMS